MNVPVSWMSEDLYPEWYIFAYLSLDLKNRKAAMPKLEVYDTGQLSAFMSAVRMYVKSYGIRKLEIPVISKQLDEVFFPATPYWNAGHVDEKTLVCMSDEFNCIDIETYYISQIEDSDTIQSVMSYYEPEPNYYIVPDLYPYLDEYGDNIPPLRIKSSPGSNWKITPIRFFGGDFNPYTSSWQEIGKLQLVTTQNINNTHQVGTVSIYQYSLVH
jgi:hypothetical protein